MDTLSALRARVRALQRKLAPNSPSSGSAGWPRSIASNPPRPEPTANLLPGPMPSSAG